MLIVEMAEAHAIAPLKQGDGVVFDAADWRSPGEPEEGGRVYRSGAGAGWEAGTALRQSRDPVRSHPAGDLVWRTDDPDVAQAARPFHGSDRRRFDGRWCGSM